MLIHTFILFLMQIELPITAPLNSLKDRISKSSLGPIKSEFRLFHLGRELKSGRRSLATLGIGRFDNFVVHLHSTAPPSAAEVGDEVVEVKTVAKRPNSTEFSNNSRINQPVIDLIDDGESEDEIPHKVKRGRRR